MEMLHTEFKNYGDFSVQVKGQVRSYWENFVNMILKKDSFEESHTWHVDAPQ